MPWLPALDWYSINRKGEGRMFRFGVGDYTMRNGWNARVYEVSAGLLIGVRDNVTRRVAETWSPEGKIALNGDSDYDLMPTKRKMWANIYPDGKASLHNSKDAADKHVGRLTRIACILVEYTDGEGVQIGLAPIDP